MRRRLPLAACRLAGLVVGLGWAGLGLAACTSQSGSPSGIANAAGAADFEQNNDPLEPSNRVVYAVNDALDTAVLAPLARGYRAVVPAPVRNGVHNILSNLSNPVVLSNDIMEAKPRRAGDTFMRMLINSTVGIGGIMDVASKWGYPAHESDFGITLALWGVDSGPFLYLPVLGPSNPRDAAGFGADIALDPFTYVSGGAWTIFGYTRYGVTAVDTRERLLGEISSIKKTALDPYATFRSLYDQHRAQVIDTVRHDNRSTPPSWYPQPAPATGEPSDAH